MINKTINNIRFIRKLDLGGFSSVWLAVHEVTHKQLAVKVIPKFVSKDSVNFDKVSQGLQNEEKNEGNFESNANDQKQAKDNSNDLRNTQQLDLKKKSHFETEIQILSKINHPLVLGFFGDFEDEENQFICMEYLPNGSLLDYINTHTTTGGLKPIVARRLFTELLITIEYLHKQLKIFHRDLKCENILIDANNNIRLIDFGFSVMYNNANDTFTDKFGSSGYTCPEMINNVPYTPEKSDLWCLGIILYSMLVGKLPFDGNNDVEIAEKIAFEEPEYPSFLSKNSVDLLRKILTKNPYRRIDIDSIKKHPFLSQTELSIISRLSPDHSNSPCQLDSDILFELSMNDKVDIKKLTVPNKSTKFSQEMLMYKQLKRNKDTKLAQEIIEGKITSLSQKKIKKHCQFHISDECNDNISCKSNRDQMMPTSSSMPFDIYDSRQIHPKVKFNYCSPDSNPDISNAIHHSHTHIPHPENKKLSQESTSSNLNQIGDSLCDHYVEDTIIDDDDDDEISNFPRTTFGNARGGLSTPNFLSLKSPSESENENDSESHRHKHKSKSKKSSKSSVGDNQAHNTDNIPVSFPSTSFSFSSLSTFSNDQNEQKYLKKDSIRIAPRRRSKVPVMNGPKSILSFIH
ncbi:hypothetical protein M9Y10_023263 [Tritrichomonas musculus]|uniref:Protein kinase domain-containing protein n=1 Tax=Tritrichomonas musculus TaxID=1915356 RepID=A0ABR2KUQ1_9EUKA